MPPIVWFAAYSKELPSSGAPTGTDETGSPPIFTRPRLRHVIASRRGMGRSQGTSTEWFNDQDVEDHAKLIEWAAAQPWGDGNVVTFSTSYYGVTQPQVAARQPSALKGFCTIEMCTDYFRHIVIRRRRLGSGACSRRKLAVNPSRGGARGYAADSRR